MQVDERGNLTITTNEQKGLKPKSPITISPYNQNIHLQNCSNFI